MAWARDGTVSPGSVQADVMRLPPRAMGVQTTRTCQIALRIVGDPMSLC